MKVMVCEGRFKYLRGETIADDTLPEGQLRVKLEDGTERIFNKDWLTNTDQSEDHNEQ
jgi:hypothetical protein